MKNLNMLGDLKKLLSEKESLSRKKSAYKAEYDFRMFQIDNELEHKNEEVKRIKLKSFDEQNKNSITALMLSILITAIGTGGILAYALLLPGAMMSAMLTAVLIGTSLVGISATIVNATKVVLPPKTGTFIYTKQEKEQMLSKLKSDIKEITKIKLIETKEYKQILNLVEKEIDDCRNKMNNLKLVKPNFITAINKRSFDKLYRQCLVEMEQDALIQNYLNSQEKIKKLQK